jgi:hypothetical protein
MLKHNVISLSIASRGIVTLTLTNAVSATAGLELAVVNAEVHVARRSLHAQEPCVCMDHLHHVGVVPCQPEGPRRVLVYERPCRI